jgi:hypothetical protein
MCQFAEEKHATWEARLYHEFGRSTDAWSVMGEKYLLSDKLIMKIHLYISDQLPLLAI